MRDPALHNATAAVPRFHHDNIHWPKLKKPTNRCTSFGSPQLSPPPAPQIPLNAPGPILALAPMQGTVDRSRVLEN